MYKIGILGSDNSHALAFAKLANIRNSDSGEYLFPDARITGIFGLEKEQTEKVASEGHIEFVAETPEELLKKVDAVMVVFRQGDLHAKYAKPFIEAGIPAWIDKPFTVKVSDAVELIEIANKKNVLVTGGSTCKQVPSVLELKNAVENDSSMGKILSGTMNFTSYLDNEYGRLFFYGPHLVEMTMTVFGYDMKSVAAYTDGENINAIARYDRYNIVMNFINAWKGYYGIVYGSENTLVKELDFSSGYRIGFEKFIEMLRSGKQPFPLEQLLVPTVALNALNKSMMTGHEIKLSEIL